MKWLGVALLLVMDVACDNPSENDLSDSTIPNSVETIYSDMTQPHEGVMNGVPDHFDWSARSRLGLGNKPPSDWSAVIPWGAAYRNPNPITAKNTRIQIKNLQAWFLDNGNSWQKWTLSDKIYGRLFFEDFREDLSIEADIRQESTGGISFRIVEGYNFHFWSEEGRITMNPATIKGVWICVDARLILHDASGVDDRHRANFLLGSGGDYWKDKTVQWDNFVSSGDIATGRMKYVTKSWKSFNTHTLTPDQLRTFPPPF